MTKPLFISYRRVDSAHALLLWEKLHSAYGSECLFYDKSRNDGIPLAEDFRAVIDEALQAAECMLVLIGPGWMDEAQLRRLYQEKDVVRHEIVTTLARKKAGEAVTILPVLFGNAQMPTAEQLPDELKPLTEPNAVALSTSPDEYENGVDAIREVIDGRCPGLRARLCNRRLGHVLADVDQSKSVLGQNVAVSSKTHTVIPRQAALQALDDWWNAWPQHHDAFVLIGDEGDGKSWAVAHWLARLLESPNFPIPLVYVPTQKLDSCSLLDVVAEGLARVVPGDEPKHHRIVLSQQLARSCSGAPLSLLVVDALNERSCLAWPTFFDDLRVATNRQRIAVIVLCRTDYWNSLSIPKDGLATVWTLDPYSDAELDELLHRRGSSRRRIQASYSADVLKLLHRPRYFDLAFRLKDEVGHGGLTLERLIYEDWRDQTARKSRRPLDHDGFLALMQDLAKTYKDRQFELQQLGERAKNLGADVIELRHELTSSRIIDQSGCRLRLGKKHLALALGLVLAQEVEDASSPAKMAEIVSQRLAGSREADLQVRICAMALFHALVTRDYPDEGRFALLRAWIEGRNLDGDDLRRIPAYLPLQPRLYLQLAEILWGELDNREAQDHFMTGLLQHREHTDVKKHLMPTFTRWLGFVHPCGHRAFWGGEETQVSKGLKEVTERLGHSPEPGTLHVLDVELEIIKGTRTGLMRLAQVALAVMSHQRHVGRDEENALATGLTASAVMKGGQTDFNWVLRIAPTALRQALLQRANEWLRMPAPIALHAANDLLRALGSEAANQLIETMPMQFRTELTPFRIRWQNEHEIEQELQNDHLSSPEQIARNLGEIALNPAFVLNPEHVTRIQDAGADLNLNEISRVLGRTSEDLTLEQIEPALCAFAPFQYRNLMCRIARTLVDRSDVSRKVLTSRLLKHVPILGEKERSILHVSWQACVQKTQPEERSISTEEAAELFLFPAVLFELDAYEKMLCIIDRKEAHGWWTEHQPTFWPISQHEALAGLEHLRRLPTDQQAFLSLLGYLAETLLTPSPELRGWLLPRLQTFDSTTRGLCLQIFHNSGDEKAANEVIASGWRALESLMRWENLWGSLLLARFGKSLTFSELRARISPEHLGYAVRQRGNLVLDVANYVRVLDETLTSLMANSERCHTELEDLAPHTQITVDFSASPAQDTLGSADRGNIARRINNVSWGGSAGNSSVEEWQRSADPEALINESNELARKVGELQKSQRAAGNPWFGSSFQHGSLELVLRTPASPWRKWIEPLIANSPHAATLLACCRGFYEKLCTALLSYSPADGVALFKAIERHPGVRITEAPIGLSVLRQDAFSAPATNELDDQPQGLLFQLIDSATCDQDLFEYTLLAQRGGRAAWLRHLIERWLRSDREFDQARALTLLGLSALQEDADRLQKWGDKRGDSWLRNVAIAATKRAQRHEWARTWFQRFLDRENRAESWAAFRLFLHCADRRIWLWIDNSDLQQAERWKQEAFRFNLGEVVSACQRGEKRWNEVFLEHKVKPDEYWPWMDRYLHGGQ